MSLRKKFAVFSAARRVYSNGGMQVKRVVGMILFWAAAVIIWQLLAISCQIAYL